MSLKDLVEINEKCRIVRRDILEDGDAVLGVSVSDWLARIPLVDWVYIEAFPKHDGIGICLDPELSWNTNLPVNTINKELISHLADYGMRGKQIFVYRGTNDDLLTRLEEEDCLDRVFKELGIVPGEDDDELDLLEKADLSKSVLFSRVSYAEFDKRLTALKRVLKENDCFGFKTYPVNLTNKPMWV